MPEDSRVVASTDCTWCGHQPHPPGQCDRRILTADGTQDCPCQKGR